MWSPKTKRPGREPRAYRDEIRWTRLSAKAATPFLATRVRSLIVSTRVAQSALQRAVVPEPGALLAPAFRLAPLAGAAAGKSH